MSSLTYITSAEVEKSLDWSILLESIEKALGHYSVGKDGGVVQPVRTVLAVEKHHGYMGVMPAYSSYENALATKVVSFYPENKELPTHQAWVLLLDPPTGALKAIVDGEAITSIRTALASAVATKHLSNPASKVLAILGAGIQARSHYKALRLIQNFDEVRVWSRTHSNAQKFAQEIGAKVCSNAEEAVKNADIICTVTFSTTPILQAAWVKPGAHINAVEDRHELPAVGACVPEWQELDSELMRNSVVYCDSRDACNKESGDIIVSQCEIYAEIGEVIMGQKEAQWKKTTIFKSVGMAIEDVVSAKMVYDNYIRKNPRQ